MTANSGLGSLSVEITLIVQEIRQLEEISPEQLHKFGELGHALKSGICMIGCERLALLCNKIGA